MEQYKMRQERILRRFSEREKKKFLEGIGKM